jgi:O-Antigen ligase
MLESLTVMNLLVWVPVLVHLITRNGLSLLLSLLLVAPLAANLVGRPGANPLFGARIVNETYDKGMKVGGYFKADTSIRLNELFNPTRVVIGLFVIVFLLRALLRKNPLGLDITETLMLVFSVFLVLNVLVYSRRIAFSLRVATDAFIIPFMTYYIARRLVISEERFHRLVRILGYVGCYIIVIGFMERLTLGGGIVSRIQGPFASGQELQVVMAVIFFTVLADWLRSRATQNCEPSLSFGTRWFILCFAPMIILLIFSRGAWVGFLIGVWTFLFLGRGLFSTTGKIGMTGVTLISVPLIAAGILVIGTPEELTRRITNIKNIESRFETWSAITRGGLNNVVTVAGIGLNNLRDALNQTGHVLGTTHNCYLSMLMELGLFGLLSYLAIVASILKQGLRLYGRNSNGFGAWLGISILAIMVAYQIPSLFANNLYLTGVSHVFVFALIGGVAGLASEGRVGSRVWMPSERRNATLTVG